MQQQDIDLLNRLEKIYIRFLKTAALWQF